MYSEIENILMAYSINLMENPVFLFSRFLTPTARGGIVPLALDCQKWKMSVIKDIDGVFIRK